MEIEPFYPSDETQVFVGIHSPYVPIDNADLQAIRQGTESEIYVQLNKWSDTTGYDYENGSQLSSAAELLSTIEYKWSRCQALTSAPILTYPWIDKDFILDTDASNEGIGDVLSQNIRNEERVIAYFRKSLGKPERLYCVTRKELLDIFKSIEHFHYYLYGKKLLLRTHQASLKWLLKFKEPEGQIARWIQTFQEYDFEIQHRKRTSHGNADTLSRRPSKESCKQ
ncbi:Retrovirus-related Pol polyprotein from transposon 297 [Araneus ventricosus]|uniref:Retrovirus-related Pol polyprotein from transposon 297 n=1 Tax=Araneus ventricosus TaxID=182803 RepID=A0A4Y2MMX7_ARAVE|nr:Retrovirus-related Pol polyprotein from transposon 297 [Araneus ventricosus]